MRCLNVEGLTTWEADEQHWFFSFWGKHYLIERNLLNGSTPPEHAALNMCIEMPSLLKSIRYNLLFIDNFISTSVTIKFSAEWVYFG